MRTGTRSVRDQEWVLPLGSASREGWDVVVDDDLPGWQHTGLRVVTLEAGERATFDGRGWECVAVPLEGGFTLQVATADGGSATIELAGRDSVFSGPSDVAYLPAGSHLEVSTSAQRGRLALCLARLAGEPSTRQVRHVGAGEVPVELRGAGTCSREVRNFGTPGVLDADAIITCEVLTPAGNWSSYPPHKHDEARGEEEAELEEIYYFETRVEGGASRDAADAVGYQRVYGTAERPIDVLTEVRTGDVVLVPHGWHGPSMAPPGYDLYYLNVMAGPGPQRAWLICDDPDHAWVRSGWGDQDIDPRLPLGGDPA